MEKIDYLIEYLLKEAGRDGFNYSSRDKKSLYRALVNIREPKPISNEYLKIENEYLKEELKKSKITNVNSISKLVNLTSLMITVSKFDSKILSNLKSLENLYLGIDYEDLDDLKKQYPNINIELLSECV